MRPGPKCYHPGGESSILHPGRALKIWIDADAAPRDVKEIVMRRVPTCVSLTSFRQKY